MKVNPPNALLALTEGPRALADMACLGVAAPLLRKYPRARTNHGVMVIPGFMGDDRGNGPLIRYLRHLGYIASGWGQGRNKGADSTDQEKLQHDIEILASAGDGEVSLVGHSLGGIYAREMARRAPAAVRQVITLGSPFGKGHRQASNAARLYQRLNPSRRSPEEGDYLWVRPPVPTTAIFTRADGVVNWRTSVQEGEFDDVDNIEVPGSHTGLSLNPSVWFLLAKKLA